MDLSTTYLGLKLAHPLMPGSSPLAGDLDSVRALEDAGAAAIVMHSLFEEQISAEQLANEYSLDADEYSFAEALSYYPGMDQFRLGPDEYLEHLQRVKSAVSVPVIGSLNGVTPEGWLAAARLLQQAGADALELNVYYLATDPQQSGADVERQVLEMLRLVREQVQIPIAVKLAPFYSALTHFAAELKGAGADGLVLFNRFYQPDIDVEARKVRRTLRLSDSGELLLRLHWSGILSDRIKTSIAVSGGVHTGEDAIKAVLSGAHAVQVVSALLQKGPEQLRVMRNGITHWLERHGCESLATLRGSLSLVNCPDPLAYERANYLETLHKWRR